MNLTEEERTFLLREARTAIESALRGESLPPSETDSPSAALRAEGASFVTLTMHGRLRGCIGSLQAYRSLLEDVRTHAVDAALRDPRFASLRPEELPAIEIEISRLTAPQPLPYTTPEDLIAHLRPRVDGVILQDGLRRATFLPQVWDSLPDPEQFLSELCLKMGAPPDLWRRKSLTVQVYQVEEFHE
jgi:uncharacterized protein